MDEDALEALRRGTGSSFPFLERIGLTATEVAVGRCTLHLPLAPNVNHFGSMYAGALYTVAEVPGGVLFRTTFDQQRFFPLVKSSAIRFRKAAWTDVTVTATLPDDLVERTSAAAEEHGKADYDLEVEVLDEEGDVVVTMSSTYQLRLHGSLKR